MFHYDISFMGKQKSLMYIHVIGEVSYKFFIYALFYKKIAKIYC